MGDDARILMCEQLKAAGFIEVTMLSKASEPLNALEPGPRGWRLPEAGVASVFCKTCLQ